VVVKYDSFSDYKINYDGEFLKGEFNGMGKEYNYKSFPDKIYYLKYDGFFENGELKKGKHYIPKRDGDIMYKGKFKDGQVHGKAEKYIDGKLVESGTYKYGEKNGKIIGHKHGKQNFYAKFKNDNFIEGTFHKIKNTESASSVSAPSLQQTVDFINKRIGHFTRVDDRDTYDDRNFFSVSGKVISFQHTALRVFKQIDLKNEHHMNAKKYGLYNKLKKLIGINPYFKKYKTFFGLHENPYLVSLHSRAESFPITMIDEANIDGQYINITCLGGLKCITVHRLRSSEVRISLEDSDIKKEHSHKNYDGTNRRLDNSTHFSAKNGETAVKVKNALNHIFKTY